MLLLRPKWTRKRWQWIVILHSPKLQHDWNLTSDCLMSYAILSLVGGGLIPNPCREAVGVFCSHSRLGNLLSGPPVWQSPLFDRLFFPLSLSLVVWHWLADLFIIIIIGISNTVEFPHFLSNRCFVMIYLIYVYIYIYIWMKLYIHLSNNYQEIGFGSKGLLCLWCRVCSSMLWLLLA